MAHKSMTIDYWREQTTQYIEQTMRHWSGMCPMPDYLKHKLNLMEKILAERA